MPRSLGISATAFALAALVATPAAHAGFNHAPFDKILRAHVKNGRVDYAGIKANAGKELDAYVAAIGSGKVSGKKNCKLAFYLNAYNALVIKAVVDRLPVTSVMKVKGFFKKVSHKLEGKSVTLDAIENKIIRPTFKDARIHFALVCAARSCPPLMSRAFKGKTVDKDLDRLAKRFVGGSGVRKRGDKFKISKLFQWYAGDFKDASGSVGKYLAKYRAGDAEALGKMTKFAYLGYSWRLNKK